MKRCVGHSLNVVEVKEETGQIGGGSWFRVLFFNLSSAMASHPPSLSSYSMRSLSDWSRVRDFSVAG